MSAVGALWVGWVVGPPAVVGPAVGRKPKRSSLHRLDRL